MCEPASFVVTKGNVFWSRNTDSHEEIIREFDLKEMVNRAVTLVRVEIMPPNRKFAAPPQEWQWHVDQDILPKWWDEKDAERRCRVELKAWIKAKVCTKGTAEVREGTYYACGSAQVKACGSAQVKAWDSAQVTACGSAQVKACDSAQVTACGSAQVTAYGSAQVAAYGSAQVTAYGPAQVKAYDSAQVKAYDSAQVTAYGSAQVKACDSAQVTAYRSATVIQYCSGCAITLSDAAVLVDRSGDGKPVCTVAGDK